LIEVFRVAETIGQSAPARLAVCKKLGTPKDLEEMRRRLQQGTPGIEYTVIEGMLLGA